MRQGIVVIAGLIALFGLTSCFIPVRTHRPHQRHRTHQRHHRVKHAPAPRPCREVCERWEMREANCREECISERNGKCVASRRHCESRERVCVAKVARCR